MSLTDFLLARIADESTRVDKMAQFGDVFAICMENNDRGDDCDWSYYGDCDLATLRAGIEAKRQRVVMLDDMERHADNPTSSRAYHLLCLEAVPFASHPDYDESWKP